MPTGYQPLSRPNVVPDDPFYIVKQKTQNLVNITSSDYDEWKVLLQDKNTAEDRRFKHLHKRLQTNLKSIKADIHSLQQTITTVEKHRGAFQSINDEELESRRKFVYSIRSVCQYYTDEMHSSATKHKMADDQKALLIQSPSGYESVNRGSNSSRGSQQRGGASYVMSKAEQQKLLQEEQDLVLDDMSAALGRLGDVAGDVHGQLLHQHSMLEDLDQEMGVGESQMDMVTNKLEKVLGKSDRGKWTCIFWLIVIIIIEILLIVYT